MERLFGFRHALDDALVRGVVIAIAATLLVATLIVWALGQMGRLSDQARTELGQRLRSWAVLAPLMIVPILLGAAWTVGAIGLLSLLCYREFARATGLFREKIVSLTVALGIIAVTWTAFDNWYRLFLALFPLMAGAIAALALLSDRPEGYIQRVALGVFSFAFFGVAFGHLSFFASDAQFRPILLWLLVVVQLNDIFAYVAGKTLGQGGPLSRKLCPATSPNKTIAGALGALMLTTPLVAFMAHLVFADTVLDRPSHLLVLGLLVSVLGQGGDLMLSSIKRDIGIKDMAASIPGHGGLLDRFDSLILVSPAVFHYINAWLGVGVGSQTQIFSSHWF